MIFREASNYIEAISRFFPVITITGPRQSGKTTLAKHCFPDHKYCSLEDPDTRIFAETDPRGFLLKFDGSVIIDEVQNVPSLLSYIQTIVDARSNTADFILTGSHQPRLAEAISQSLAGRTGMVRLYPLTQAELSDHSSNLTPLQQCLYGFFPAVYAKDIPPALFYPNYYQTYLERDVRQLVNIKNTRQFQIFIRLLAGRTGQLVNYNSLAADTGVSNNTIKEWISILEASYIIYTLPPYFKNLRKRLVKSPKIYFTDTGLLCNLLGIEDLNQLERDPLRGSIFENLIVMDLVKELCNKGKNREIYFLRDSKGFEIDLIIEQRGIVKLIEIKSASTWNRDFHRNLKAAESLFEGEKNMFLVYSGEESMNIDNVNILPATSIRNIIK